MKNKKFIILSSVAAIVVIGVVLSLVIDWPTDSERSSGDIGKSVRFSQKVSTEKLTNMEELLRADTAYRQDIAEAYVLMHSRVLQFDELVDLSNKVAGNTAEFADLLKEMNAMRSTVTNASAQLGKAGNDLEAVLSGKECPDLEQNVINASLAYTTMQKQNSLADRFIETADKYLKKNKANDELKLVRDGWMEYQQMTAALEGDAKAAKRLEELGYQLTEEQTLAFHKNREDLGIRITNLEELGVRITNLEELGIKITNLELLGVRSPILLGMRDPAFHNTEEVLGFRRPREINMRDPAFHNTEEVLGSRRPREINMRDPAFHNNDESIKAINDVIIATAQGLKIIVINSPK